MSVDFGDGRDGNLTVLSGTFDINTDPSGARSYADGISYKVMSNPNTIFISIGINPNGIVIGDKVLLINLQGSTSDYDDVGNWEVFDITDVQTTSVQVDRPPIKSYDGTSWANQKVVMQRIPQYDNVTVSGTGEITASIWDRMVTAPAGASGYYTATVAMFVADTLHVSNNVNVSDKGYAGGPETGGSNAWGYPGESTGQPNTTIYGNNNYKPEGGAGGAYYPSTGGYGGGHGTAGNGTGGAPVFGDAPLSRMNFGGGGGGSGCWTDSRSSKRGGHGGGIIYIHARTIYTYGFITAAGQIGGAGVKQVDNNSGAGGGGGAGGTIYIKTYDLYGTGSSVSAVKGEGGPRDVTATASEDGHDGGDGLTRLDYSRINGQDYPYDIGADSIVDPDPYVSRLPYGWYYFSGYTKFLYDVPASGIQLYVYRRDTGEYMGTTTSSGNGGFEILTTHSGDHFLVALDAPIGGDYNDLVIGKITPAYHV